MTQRKWIGPKEIGRILAAVQGLGLHPEAVRIPLDAEGSGSVTIAQGRAVIVAPATGDLDAWIEGLPAKLQELPGFGGLKRG